MSNTRIINYDPTGNYKIKHSRPLNYIPAGSEPKVDFQETVTKLPSTRVEAKSKKKEIKSIDKEIKKSEE